MALCISQLHPITVYVTVFGCALFWYWVSLCVPFTISLMNSISSLFQNDGCDHYCVFMANNFISNYAFRLSVTKQFLFCKCVTPWMFPPLDILLEYWIEHVTFGLFYVMFTFPIMIFYRGFLGFAMYRPCSAWCRGFNHLPPVCWSTIRISS